MGRRGNMRSRPGILFFLVFAVCLVIVYLSWRSLMAPPSIKVKDSYSSQMHIFDEDDNSRKHLGKFEGIDENRIRDPNYEIDEANTKEKLINSLSQKFKLPTSKNKILSRGNATKDFNTIAPVKVTPESETKPYYLQPDGSLTEVVNSMDRLVHLDLKGAAPKMSYLRELIPLAKKLGATGLLVEYEDMFPYTGKLEGISSKSAYSRADVKELLDLAKTYQLTVMPLIQTFGHMEFVLKSEFPNLRESEYTPQVIDVTKNESYMIISEMVKQILEAHPETTYLHIGCDEVYELGKGASAIEMRSKHLTPEEIFVRYVQQVAAIVKKVRPNVTPIIWDDELRKLPMSYIKNSALPSVVEIMVWSYRPQVTESISGQVWDKYAQLFKSVWVASAFKGATGARQLLTEPQHHVQNHISWLETIAANSHRISFKGIALTGWQRYDHFATLCDLLPVAVPSLAVCLATIVNAGFTKEIHLAVSKQLGCSNLIEMTFPAYDKVNNRAIVTQDCRFPGHEVYYAVQELYGYALAAAAIQQRLDGWLSDYQVSHGFSNPGQLRVLSKLLAKQNSGYQTVAVPLQTHLAKIYSSETVEEWIDENIKEQQRDIEEQQKKVSYLLQFKTWPQRPIALNPSPAISSKLNRTISQNKPYEPINLGNSDRRNQNEIISTLNKENTADNGQLKPLELRQSPGQGYLKKQKVRGKLDQNQPLPSNDSGSKTELDKKINFDSLMQTKLATSPTNTDARDSRPFVREVPMDLQNNQPSRDVNNDRGQEYVSRQKSLQSRFANLRGADKADGFKQAPVVQDGSYKQDSFGLNNQPLKIPDLRTRSSQKKKSDLEGGELRRNDFLKSFEDHRRGDSYQPKLRNDISGGKESIIKESLIRQASPDDADKLAESRGDYLTRLGDKKLKIEY